MKTDTAQPICTPECYYLLHNGMDYNFTIETESNFLPHDGVFAVIVADEENKNILFKELMEHSYDFDGVDEIGEETTLEGYCIYNIGFAEAMNLAKLVSSNNLFYRNLEKKGCYCTSTGESLREVFFE